MARILFISITIFISITSIAYSQNKASLNLNNLPMRNCIDSLIKHYSVSIVYLDNDVENKTSSLTCQNCSFEDALNQMLLNSGLNWIANGSQVIISSKEINKHKLFSNVHGIISDSSNGEYVSGATITLHQIAEENKIYRYCSSNNYGFFSISKIPFGKYILKIKAMGYEPAIITIDLSSQNKIQHKISLKQKEIILNETIIEGYRSTLTSSVGIGKSIYRRTAPFDNNLYFIDGARVFNPTHFGGVISSINSDVMNNMEIALGGIPPDYGGMIGNYLGLSIRNGSAYHINASGSISNLSTTIFLDGPISSNTTFIISARKAFSTNLFLNNIQEGGGNLLEFVELNAKVTHKISSSSNISISTYISKDNFNKNVMTDNIISNNHLLKNNFYWENKIINLKLINVALSSLFLETSVYCSNYNFNIKHNAILENPYNILSIYNIFEYGLKSSAELFYDEFHTFKAGIELINHGIDGKIDKFSTLTNSYNIPNYNAIEFCVYFQDQLKLLDNVSAELGARAQNYFTNNQTFSSVDPRFSLLFVINNKINVYSSISSINQFIHPYRNSGIFLMYPTMFWYPSSDKIKTSTLLHKTLGVEYIIDDGKYNLNAEFYHRTTNNAHKFSNLSSATDVKIDEAISYYNSTKYGFMISARKRIGNITGAVNYNYSISDNCAYNPFVRKHELSAWLDYKSVSGWIIGSFISVASTNIITTDVKDGYYEQVYTNTYNKVRGYYFLSNADASNSDFPGLKRLELYLSKDIQINNFNACISLRLINRYGIVDPFRWIVKSDNNKIVWEATLYEEGIFPLYPILEFKIIL